MQKEKNLKLIFIFLLLTLVLTGFTGCNRSNTQNTPPVDTLPTEEGVLTPTSTLTPESMILIDSFGLAGDAVIMILNEFAEINNLLFTARPTLEGDFSGVRIAVVFGNSVTLPDITAGNPQVQFIVISNNDFPTSPNVSLIRPDTLDLAFMAGYISMLTAEDWRAGGIVTDDSNVGVADAFSNGGKYFCGFCSPVYPPYKSFPIVGTVSSSASSEDWSLQIASFAEYSVHSIFIDRSGDTPEILDQFSEIILYSNNLSSPNIDRYAAILGADPISGLEQLLPNALAGQGGKSIITKVALIRINNTEIVSPAKKALFDTTAQDLFEDWINPLSIQ